MENAQAHAKVPHAVRGSGIGTCRKNHQGNIYIYIMLIYNYIYIFIYISLRPRSLKVSFRVVVCLGFMVCLGVTRIALGFAQGRFRFFQGLFKLMKGLASFLAI